MLLQRLMAAATLRFLAGHLPLTPEQRALQSLAAAGPAPAPSGNVGSGGGDGKGPGRPEQQRGLEAYGCIETVAAAAGPAPVWAGEAEDLAELLGRQHLSIWEAHL